MDICLCLYPGLSELWVEGQRKIPKRNERIQRESEPQVAACCTGSLKSVHGRRRRDAGYV